MTLLFDPQTAELLGHDLHLPPVPLERLTHDALAERFELPPVWQPDEEPARLLFAGPNAVAASVLIPLVMRPEPTVLLTLRTTHLKSHGGQISFPGGRSEPTDAHAIETALREAREEIGLKPERVRVVGALPLYTTNTGFVVTPVVGLIEPLPHEENGLAVQADPHEVAEIFEVPLRFLMNPTHHQRRVVDVTGTRLEFLSMSWTPDGHDRSYFIWGATAAMLRNLYRFLAA